MSRNSGMHTPKLVSHWHVYSYLKQVNGKATLYELVNRFSDPDKIAEGIKEYNEMAIEHPYYNRFQNNCYGQRSVCND